MFFVFANGGEFLAAGLAVTVGVELLPTRPAFPSAAGTLTAQASDTDIVVSSTRAYVNALSKMLTVLKSSQGSSSSSMAARALDRVQSEKSKDRAGKARLKAQEVLSAKRAKRTIDLDK